MQYRSSLQVLQDTEGDRDWPGRNASQMVSWTRYRIENGTENFLTSSQREMSNLMYERTHSRERLVLQKTAAKDPCHVTIYLCLLN